MGIMTDKISHLQYAHSTFYTHIRDLGISYNSKLCFHDYIDEIVCKA